ncbi:hypothetical protein [Roseivirga echinicomitans]|nr:hypothetical protein [Roseivirga echinicomitans]
MTARFIISSFIMFLVIFPMKSQTVPKEQVEQLKRLGRTNDHIEKVYKGEIIKLLFGKFEYGGSFDGVVFRTQNGKVILARLSPIFGTDIKPYLVLNETVEMTIIGDELLLEEMIYKDDYIKKLEKELKGPIQGLGNIKRLTSSNGTFELGKIDKEYVNDLYGSPMTTVINVNVLDRKKLDKNKGMLILENGDTLVLAIDSKDDEPLNSKKISYLKFEKGGENGRYYKGKSTYKLYHGEINSHDILIYTPFAFNSSLLETLKVKPVEFVSDDSGLVTGIEAKSKKYGLQVYSFNSKDARKISQSFNVKDGDSLNFHFSVLGKNYHLKAIERNENELILTSRFETRTEEDYIQQNEPIEGTVNKIFYAKKNVKSSFRGLLMNDSIYVKVNSSMAISIAKLIKEGKPVKIEGWKRKELDSEINMLGYTIFIPSKITVNGKTFTTKVNLTRSL